MTRTECADVLRAGDNYLLITHQRPDGDSLGSAAALCMALRALGKMAYLYPNAQATSMHRGYASPFFAPEEFAPSCTVAMDVASENQFPIGFSGYVNLCIDHHMSNTFFAGETYVKDEASCGEVVFGLIQELGVSVTPEMASALYIAVSTDTGCFCFTNTTAHTLRAAAELVSLGAENGLLNKRFFRTFSAARIALEGLIYSGLRRFRDGKINIAVVTLAMLEQTGAIEDDLEDIAALPGRVAGSIVSVTIRQTGPKRCRISVRSMPAVDSNTICQKFGGGGHSMAAGCTIDAGPEACCALLLSAIEEELK